MDEFFSFKTMITPMIIRGIFFAGVGLSMLIGLIMFGTGLSSSFGGGLTVLMGLFIMVAGPLIVRLWCELAIIFFRMNETLTEISNNLAQRSSAQAGSAAAP